MRASYSASLLIVGKENWRAYSRVESSGEMRTISTPLAEDMEDPSIYKVHDGIFDVSSSAGSSKGTSCATSGSSSGTVHSAMKSARI